MKNTQENKRMIYDIPVLALRGVTIFPGVVFHFDVARQKSIKALEHAMEHGQRLFVVTQRDIRDEMPTREQLFQMGTYCKIRQILRVPGDGIRVLVEGKQRAVLERLTSEEEFLVGEISILAAPSIKQTKKDEAFIRNVRELVLEYDAITSQVPNEVIMTVLNNNDFAYISDYIAQNIHLGYEDKQTLLEQTDPRRRMSQLIKLLASEVEILDIEQDIQEKVKEQMDKNQRDYYLREQAKVISEELGEGEDTASEAQNYITKIEKLALPAEITEKLIKEAKRLSRLQSSSPEGGVIRTYLDTCLEIPWTTVKKENEDIKKAHEILEEDHFGLADVKERILEFFAVKQLTGGVKGQIICLAGPPGVGKTSVARSIARAMGRDYVRLSLGGVRDEADIRGHRKTYIGAMPGRIIDALKKAKSRNCLMLIDEIDKLGSDYKGDPSSALLEVFDTEQNIAFRDHFVELPIDLSDVLFITTANNIGTIPAPLRDRMEIITLSGYTDEEKLQIARKHLLPKQLKKHGLKAANMKLSDDAMRSIMTEYTKEAGVRSLERAIAKLCRKTARHMSETGKKSLSITGTNLSTYLGTPKFKKDNAPKQAECGVVNGLAWTGVGGDLLEVEVMTVEGTGKLELTGNLGDVMKESVRAAITYIRSRAQFFALNADFYTKNDIHVHFPEGAVPKDGPSAGIATATAIISALTDMPVAKTIAMTGEISLRGRVLAIGGLKEKTMAAYRNGVTTVIVPEENRPDIDDIDPIVKQHLNFVFASHMNQVVDEVFGNVFSAIEKAIMPKSEEQSHQAPPPCNGRVQTGISQ